MEAGDTAVQGWETFRRCGVLDHFVLSSESGEDSSMATLSSRPLEKRATIELQFSALLFAIFA
jgi:hypothetical protein